MEEKNETKSEIIAVGSNSLVRTSRAIEITNKLLDESKFQFIGDFKGETVWKINAHSQAVRKIIFLQNFNQIISAGEEWFIKFWNSETGKLISEFQIENNWITALASCKCSPINFIPETNFLFCAGKSGNIHRVVIDDLDEGFSYKTIKAHELIIQDISVSKSNKLIASCSWDDKISIWNTESLECQTTFLAHNLGANSIEFINEENLIVSGGKDEKIKVWQSSGELITELSGHKHWVEAVTYCPSKNILASGCCDNTIKIWNWQDEKCLLTIINDEWINDLVFSEDGNYLIATCYNATIKVFETKNFTQIAIYSEHSKTFPFHHSIKREATNWIYSLLFDNSSKNIFSASVDGCIYKWK